MDQIGTIGDVQGLLYVVIRDQNADASFFQLRNNFLDVSHRNRIDTGKRFVQKQKKRGCHKSPCDFYAAAFASRQSVCFLTGKVYDVELSEQTLGTIASLTRGGTWVPPGLSRKAAGWPFTV